MRQFEHASSIRALRSLFLIFFLKLPMVSLSYLFIYLLFSQGADFQGYGPDTFIFQISKFTDYRPRKERKKFMLPSGFEPMTGQMAYYKEPALYQLSYHSFVLKKLFVLII